MKVNSFYRTLLAYVFLAVAAWFWPIATSAQEPTPIAKSTVGDRVIELHAVIKKPFGSDGRDRAMLMLDRDVQASLTKQAGITPWESTKLRLRERDEYVLGFLFRNTDGSLPALRVQTTSAYRAQVDQGEEQRYWPFASECPIQEVNNYEWNYKLLPMVVELPKGATRIERLEGSIVTQPATQSVLAFEHVEIARGDTVRYAPGLFIVPVETEKVASGRGYVFAVFRPNAQSLGKRMARNPNQSGSQSYVFQAVAADGVVHSANGMSQTSVPGTVLKKLRAEAQRILRQDIADKKVERNAIEFMFDKDVQVEAVRVLFQKQSEFEKVVLTVNTLLGQPTLQRFVIEGIPLAPSEISESQINEYVASLEVESPVETRREDEPPAEKVRNWRDKTGKFSVLAKLVGVNDDVVRLERSDGKTISVPIAKLSDEDAEYLKSRK